MAGASLIAAISLWLDYPSCDVIKVEIKQAVYEPPLKPAAESAESAWASHLHLVGFVVQVLVVAS